jgi:hypothetical protein
MAPTVQQWLCVNRSEAGPHIPGTDTIWTRDVEMDFLPIKGDKITLWPDEDRTEQDDLFAGVTWPVLERRFSTDDHAEIELVTMCINPGEAELALLSRLDGVAGFSDGWDVEAELEQADWTRR